MKSARGIELLEVNDVNCSAVRGFIGSSIMNNCGLVFHGASLVDL